MAEKKKIKNVDHLRVTLNSKISDVISCLQASGPVACALLYDENGRFINIITDGDVRRAILDGRTIDDPASEINKLKLLSSRAEPIVASINANSYELKQLFLSHSLRQLVLVDLEGNPISVIGYNDVNYIPDNISKNFTALIMAGGFGTRLRPYTLDTPKPMLRVNNRPMLEISIEKLVSQGANRIYISTHYLPEKIVEYFGDGNKFGVEINYIHESIPLGTGGALSLLPFHDENTLVFNGDILTRLDVEMFLAFHLRSKSALTIGAKQYHFQVPFGVIRENNSAVECIEEKPIFEFLVNSGIYFISKSVFDHLPQSENYNMTDVASNLISAGLPVLCFPIYEHWLDVGRPGDYELAKKMFPTPSSE